ncbi:hypothetical protein HKCCE2091_06970 [Rhodobacterales bacterium HKCCE2091]|nr:hypothetical protein [Rhodobacterales bacterium HKCCE2091]
MTANEAPADCVVFLNSGSGDGDNTARAEEIVAEFSRHGWQADAVMLDPGSDIPALLQEATASGVRTVVAAGGDGTICGVVEGLQGIDVELGLLPLGTFNFFARQFDIPEEVAGAVEVICTGDSTPVDIGTVNGHVFINNASLGAYATILETREDIYRKWGRSRLAAYWSVIVALVTAYRPMVMRIDVDGRTLRRRSAMAFAALSAYQLERFEMEGAEAIRRGEFALLVAPDCGRFALIWKAVKLAFRGARNGRDFELVTGRDIRIETRRDRGLVARDGEREKLSSPFEFRLIPDAIRVRVPAGTGVADRPEDRVA